MNDEIGDFTSFLHGGQLIMQNIHEEKKKESLLT
jgi:hypothetical protein